MAPVSIAARNPPKTGPMPKAPVAPLKVLRVELLIAASAAERWPQGRNPYAWFMTEEVERRYCHPYRIPVRVARREGDPAVVVAAFRTVRAGRTSQGIAWPDVWHVQHGLILILGAVGVTDYNRTLSDDPFKLACFLRGLVKEMTPGE